MIIKILGTGCPNCKKLEANTIEAMSQMGLNLPIVKVTNIEDIMSYDIMSTPGLVLDNKVISTGKVLSSQMIVELFQKHGVK
jgi:small redox-active disulfide protein 2